MLEDAPRVANDNGVAGAKAAAVDARRNAVKSFMVNRFFRYYNI
jgi:hypothetical protein